MRRKTKIIATLGPAVANPEAITGLIEAGMNVARLNFSHGDHATHRQFHTWVRDAAEQAERPIAILQDIQGPRIRVGTFHGGSAVLETGDEITLVPGEGEGSAGKVHVENLEAVDVASGSPVLMSDGLIVTEVIFAASGSVKVKVIEGGVLRDHKGVAFPGAAIHIPAVGEKDIADLEFGMEMGVDLIAASFVSSSEDIRRVRKVVGKAPVIAKIESAVGYGNLDDILEEADGAMVARGDLGVELSFQSVPRAQRDILARTNAKARVSITATEMLESMTTSPRPTRAEVTDVSNAVLDGSDAVMLSAETAVGKYPARTVSAMARICEEAEQTPDYVRGPEIKFFTEEARFASATAQACVDAAANLGIRTIVAFTESGSTARLISKYRPRANIYAFTPSIETYRKMAIYSGVISHMFERVSSTDEMISYAEKLLVEGGILEPGDGVVMAAGIPPNQRSSTNLMKLHMVGASTTGVPGSR